MCDRVTFIILFNFHFSLKVCVTSACVIQKVTQTFQKNPPMQCEISGKFEKILGADGWRKPNNFSLSSFIENKCMHHVFNQNILLRDLKKA